VDKLLVV
jgi:hypothetical protein